MFDIFMSIPLFIAWKTVSLLWHTMQTIPSYRIFVYIQMLNRHKAISNRFPTIRVIFWSFNILFSRLLNLIQFQFIFDIEQINLFVCTGGAHQWMFRVVCSLDLFYVTLKIQIFLNVVGIENIGEKIIKLTIFMWDSREFLVKIVLSDLWWMIRKETVN